MYLDRGRGCNIRQGTNTLLGAATGYKGGAACKRLLNIPHVPTNRAEYTIKINGYPGSVTYSRAEMAAQYWWMGLGN